MADQERERGRIWGLIVALPIAVVLGLFGITIVAAIMSPQGPIHDTGDGFVAVLIGSVVTAVAVWAVLYLTFIRERAPENSLGYFLIILAAIIVIDGGLVMIGITGYSTRTQNGMTRIEEQTATLQEIPQLVHVAYSPHGGAYQINSRSPGPGGDVARAALIWMKAVSGSHDHYESDLKMLDPDSTMRAPRLAAPGGIAKARAVLVKMHDNVARHRAEADAATQKFRAVLAASGVDPWIKGQMFTAFDNAVARERVTVDAIYAGDEGIATEYSALLARLAHPASVWYLKDNRIGFTDPSDLADYQAHIVKAKRYADARRAIFSAPN